MLKKLLFVIFLSVSLILSDQTRVFGALRDTVFCEQNPVLYSCVDTCTSSGGSATTAKAKSDGGNSGGCGVNENGSQANKDQVWSYFNNKFREAGYSPDEAEKATSGIMGNWLQESAFNSYRSDGAGCTGASGPITGSAGMGIAQWCGGRQQALADFAAERGQEWGCLGTQLEFTWSEMEDRDLIKSMKGLSPRDSSQIFDEVFEVSEGSGERQAKGEQMYKEYTGKDPSALGSTPSGAAAGACAAGAAGSGGPIPSAVCNETLAKFSELKGSKILYESDERIQNDLDKCTDQKIERCAIGTTSKTGGVRPQTLRGLVGIAENSGASSILLWNINTDHGCDKFDHPVGLASDIGGCGGQKAVDTEPECRKVFDYIIANMDELGVSYVIWNGDYCQQKAATAEHVSCNGDHSTHIHVSFKDS